MLAVTAAAITLTFASFVAPAAAHMGVASSDPGNGTQVAVAPEKATMTFTIDVNLDSAKAQLRHIGGPNTSITEVNRKDVKTEALAKLDGAGPGRTAVFDLPTLPAGLYALDWAVNEIDGHSNVSTIIFKVTEGATSSSTSPIIYFFGGFGSMVAVGLIVFGVLGRKK